MSDLDYPAMLQIALEEARQGRAEGGIPIGAALFNRQGQLLGRGHNRRVQEDDPSAHAETDAFRKAGGGAATATRSWSQPWRRAGIAAAWCGSFGSGQWWRENRSILLVDWHGYATMALPSTISMTPRASRSWLSTLRRIPASGMRISARSNAWAGRGEGPWARQKPLTLTLSRRERAKRAELPYADPVRSAWARSPYHGILGWDTL